MIDYRLRQYRQNIDYYISPRSYKIIILIFSMYDLSEYKL